MNPSSMPLPLSKSSSDEPQPDVYDDGYLRVEHSNYYIACGGHSLRLPLKELLIVSRLVRNMERLVLSNELWRSAWGDGIAFNAQSLHVHIYRLRHRLAPFGLHIETRVGVGYWLTKSGDK